MTAVLIYCAAVAFAATCHMFAKLLLPLLQLCCFAVCLFFCYCYCITRCIMTAVVLTYCAAVAIVLHLNCCSFAAALLLTRNCILV